MSPLIYQLYTYQQCFHHLFKTGVLFQAVVRTPQQSKKVQLMKERHAVAKKPINISTYLSATFSSLIATGAICQGQL